MRPKAQSLRARQSSWWVRLAISLMWIRRSGPPAAKGVAVANRERRPSMARAHDTSIPSKAASAVLYSPVMRRNAVVLAAVLASASFDRAAIAERPGSYGVAGVVSPDL